jgi:hypothetical protein
MLSSLREQDRFIGEVVNPIEFPVNYVLTTTLQGDLQILCFIQNREYPFAMWTKKNGISATYFEPFNSLNTNGCLPLISEFCEQAHEAWCAGNETGPAGGDDCAGGDPPEDARADEAAS